MLQEQATDKVPNVTPSSSTSSLSSWTVNLNALSHGVTLRAGDAVGKILVGSPYDLKIPRSIISGQLLVAAEGTLFGIDDVVITLLIRTTSPEEGETTRPLTLTELWPSEQIPRPVVAFKPCRCPIKNEVWRVLRRQGEEIVEREPLLETLVREAILKHESFGQALAWRLANKLAGKIVSLELLHGVFLDCLHLSRTALGPGCDIEALAMQDLVAVEERDPACRSVASVLLYFKGFKAIQCYRMAHVLWTLDRKDLAMVLQARCTEVFGIDIHPAANIGCGLMVDHGTGLVIGETAVIGSNCTLMHGVTLGGTGKSKDFDRHPKLGNGVFLGCGVTVLGNIHIGDGSTVGAGSLVLKPLPPGVTAVGSPAVVKGAAGAGAGTARGDGSSSEDEDKGTEVATKDERRQQGGLQLWASLWSPKLWR